MATPKDIGRKNGYPPTVAQRRKQAGYKIDIARCENCAHYHGELLALHNSKYRRVSAHCRLYDFFVQPASICETWMGKCVEVLTPNAEVTGAPATNATTGDNV